MLAPHVLEQGAAFIAHGLASLTFAAGDLFGHLFLEPLAEELKQSITGTGTATPDPTLP